MRDKPPGNENPTHIRFTISNNEGPADRESFLQSPVFLDLNTTFLSINSSEIK